MPTVATVWISASYYSFRSFIAASVVTNNTVHLFRDEVEIAAADTELHDPDRNVDE